MRSRLIARVAEGSVRDALSLLDQGIAHGAGAGVKVADVRAMLGLSDRGEIIDLFAHAMKGEIGEALELAARLHHAGADAAEMLIELAEFCHFVTRVKLSPSGLDDPAISEVERRRGAELAAALALGPLTRAWQILLKGVEDVKDSPRPLASAEMALIRLAYAADLPSPEDALRKLAESGESAPRAAPSAPAGSSAGSRPQGFSGAASAMRSPDPALAAAPPPPRAALPLVRDWPNSRMSSPSRARSATSNWFARWSTTSVCRASSRGASNSRSSRARPRGSRRRFRANSANGPGERWMVALAPGAKAPTLREAAEAREAERLSGVAAHPLVRKVLERFPGAKIVDVRAPDLAPAPSAPAVPADEDVSYSDSFGLDEDL